MVSQYEQTSIPGVESVSANTSTNTGSTGNALYTAASAELLGIGGGHASASVSSTATGSRGRGNMGRPGRPQMVYGQSSFYERQESEHQIGNVSDSLKASASDLKMALGLSAESGSDGDDGAGGVGGGKAGAKGGKAASKQPVKLGVLSGVALPCTQNILGVILFIRLPFLVGQAGMVFTTLIIAICVTCTSLTALSLSALATNGKIKAGGPYAILLASLGPESSASIGVLFYLATTIAATMYSLGGVEALYAVGFMGTDELFPFDRQVIGIVWTLALGCIVFAGMKYVARVGPIFFAAVISAVVLMSMGAILFAARVWSPEGVEAVADASENMWDDYVADPDTGITPSFTSLIALFFPSVTGIMAGTNRSGLLANPGRAIPRGTLGAIFTTTSIYMFTVWLFGLVVARETLLSNKLVASTIAWPHEYVVAVGIIMATVGAGLQSLAGAPQLLKSIANDGHIPFLRAFGTDHPDDEPRKAIAFTTALAATVCLAGNLDYITPIITMFFLAMYGAINFSCFLQAFLGSPSFRPTFRFFSWHSALLGFLVCVTLMFVISVLYAVVALVLISALFLYIQANREKKEWGEALFGLRLDQAMNALLDLSDIARIKARRNRMRKRDRVKEAVASSMPNSLSWFGSSSDKLAAGPSSDDMDVDVDIERQITLRAEDAGTDDEADGDVEDAASVNPDEAYMEQSGGDMTERNWRPQILVLCKLEAQQGRYRETFAVTQPWLLQLASQLKKGRGLTIVNSVMHGDVLDQASKIRCARARNYLAKQLVKNEMRGFTDVVLASGPNLLEPFRVLFQSKGLGMLSPNTVMLAWPNTWRPAETNDKGGEGEGESDGDGDRPSLAAATATTTTTTTAVVEHKEAYVQLLKDAIGCQKALVVLKTTAAGQQQQQQSGPEEALRCSQTIDVWWLMHDGDMLVLLPYLLQRHKVWAATKLRIFAIADDLVDFETSSAVLAEHLRDLRITATIEMIHVGASHARDVDMNRTVRLDANNNKTKGTILSADFFQPLAQGEDGDGSAADRGAIAPISPQQQQQQQLQQPHHSRAAGLVRALSRRTGHGSDPPKPKPVDLAQVGKIAQHIKKSSGEDTQKWIQDRYAGGAAAPGLTSLFAPVPMDGIAESDEGDVVLSMEEGVVEAPSDSESAAPLAAAHEHVVAQDNASVPAPTPPPQHQQHQHQQHQHQHLHLHAQENKQHHDLEAAYDPTCNSSHRHREAVLLHKASDKERQVKRLRTAVYLNAKIREHSLGADLVVLNLPLSRSTPTLEFIDYTEQLTQGLDRVIMLRGHGTESVSSLG